MILIFFPEKIPIENLGDLSCEKITHLIKEYNSTIEKDFSENWIKKIWFYRCKNMGNIIKNYEQFNKKISEKYSKCTSIKTLKEFNDYQKEYKKLYSYMKFSNVFPYFLVALYLFFIACITSFVLLDYSREYDTKDVPVYLDILIMIFLTCVITIPIFLLVISIYLSSWLLFLVVLVLFLFLFLIIVYIIRKKRRIQEQEAALIKLQQQQQQQQQQLLLLLLLQLNQAEIKKVEGAGGEEHNPQNQMENPQHQNPVGNNALGNLPQPIQSQINIAEEVVRQNQLYLQQQQEQEAALIKQKQE
jgi:cbb3-type cytochrome oxidase subunit 3